MPIWLVRLIDRYVGIPICFGLTVLRRICRALGIEPQSSGDPHRILFIKMSEQGATVLIHQAVERAIGMVGRENVYFCVFDSNREILDVMDCVPRQNILSLNDEGLWPMLRGVCWLMRRTRQLGIDTAIDLELFARASAIVTFLTGAKRRVGLHRFALEGLYRGDLMTHRVQHNPYLHIGVLADVLVQACRRDPNEIPLAKIVPEPVVPLSLPPPVIAEATRARVKNLLRQQGVDPDVVRLMVLNPKIDDIMPIRKWPQDRFVSLALQLLDEVPDLAIVITGLASEHDAAESMRREIGVRRTANLAGAMRLDGLLALFDMAEVLVTSDSGPAHFAALTDIHAVVLFGPETPLVYGPPGLKGHVLHKGLACSPCLNALNHRQSRCDDNQCMKMISVDEVKAAVLDCLAQRAMSI